MAIDFPASPGVNDSHTVGTTTFVWNGTYWGRSANTAKFTAADAAPSSPSLGDLWYESDSGKAFIYYDNIWVELGHASDAQSFQAQDAMPSGEQPATSGTKQILVRRLFTTRMRIVLSGLRSVSLPLDRISM